MSNKENRNQAAADEVFRSAKARRHAIELAERGRSAPERLSLEEIRAISDFLLALAGA